MFEPKGSVFTKKEIKKTFFPEHVIYDIEKDYREAMEGKILLVHDIAVDESSYLVFGKGKISGDFLWHIEKEDVIAYVPFYNLNGTINFYDKGKNNKSEIHKILSKVFYELGFYLDEKELKNIKDYLENILNKNK
jgi:hypothetical protein